VKQILQDSMTFDGSEYAGKFQFIFIDGNHEVSYVRKDTENSFKMFSEDKGCIIWHDYGHPGILGVDAVPRRPGPRHRDPSCGTYEDGVPPRGFTVTPRISR